MRRLSELSKAGRTPRGADSPRPAAVDPPAHAVADQTLPAAADAAPTLAMPRQGGAAPRAAGERGVGFDETIVAPEPTGASPRPSWDAVRFGAVALGSYAVQGELARGGLGRILRAHDARLDRPVALKELLTGGGGLEERFVREAMLTARLQHPSIVPIYEAGRWPTGEPFYAMKLVSGRSLADVIDGTPELDERLALLPHALSVAEAIAYAHSERIIHRDLKPGNVLIGPFGETVVIDWGLAKDLCLEDEEPAAEAAPQGARASRVSGPGLTMVGSVVGTPAYMPPEQAAGRRVDERADVYALGAILYHMLAGVAPYSAEDPFEIVKQVLSGPPVPLERVQPCVPRDLVTIVNKAMAREPSERYPTARELAEDLRRFQTGQIVGAHHYSARELLSRFFRRYRAQLSVLGGALLVLAAVGSLSVWRVIEARRAAEEALLHATKERDRAEAAQRRAIERADMLTLFEADAAAKRDPNASIAWLKTLSPAFERFRAARAVASDARSQGISLVLRGHTAVINSAVFSPDGRTLATAGDDRTVRLWDVATGRARVLSGHTDEVWRVAFSPDGHLLASGGKDRTIRVWDLATGESSVLAGHAAPVAALAFSRDGRRLVSRGRGERVWLWDVARGEGAALLGPPCDDEKVDFSADGSRVVFAAKGELTLVDVATGAARSFPGQDSPSTDLAISPDGARVATGDGEGVVRLWRLKTGAARELRGHEGTIRSLAFGPGGGQLVSGGRDRTVRVWDVATGSMRVLSGHEGVVYSVAVSPDGAAILSGGADHLPRLWDAQGGGSRVLRGFDDGAAWVGFSPDGGTAAIASYDQTVRLFRLSEHPDRILLRGRAAARVALISPDSRRVASAGDDGVVRTASLDTGVVRALGGHEGPIHDVCFAPSGAVIASAGEDGTVRLWLGDVGVMRVLRGHEGAVLRVACAPDGRQLASAGRDGAVRLFSLEGGEGKVLYRHEGVVRALAFSPDGKRLASGGGDRAVMEWDLAEGRARVLRGHEGDVAAVAFSPDGKVLASGAKDHTIRLWDPGTGELRRTLDASGNGVERLLFFADGSRFATLGGEANARIWETASGKLLSVLRGHNGVVLGLAVAPGGDRVATSGRDGTVRIWDLVGDVSRVLTGHTAEVGWLSFSAGGQSLVSASADGTTRFWSDELPVSGPGLRAFFEEATPDTIDLGRPGGDSDIARRLRSP